MSKPKKRRRVADRNGTPEQRYNFVVHCERLIAEKIKAGKYRDNPALEAALIDGFDPAVSLIEMAADPAVEPGLRAATSAKLLPFWHKEQSLLVKEAGGVTQPLSIEIVVAAWAGGPQARRFPASTRAVEAEVIHDAEEIAHQGNSTQPASELSVRDRLRAAARAAGETVVVHVPVERDQPATELARVSQVRGVVKPLTLQQKLENKGVGRQREVAPDTKVDSTFNLFGR